ncbi:putative zinc-binding dehydrogenase family oxidoreductase [Nemania sp. FL0031]|nr:putative zinc-binding dehydrogenase family oxidoreductase [Nemania sp. FL0031]
MPPKFQHAIVQDSKGSPQIATNARIPPLSPGTVLVKTAALALNPIDYKTGAAFPAPGSVVGMDFAGTIVDVHPDTQTRFAVGNPVCGLVYGSNPSAPDDGAFAEYVRVHADFLLRVPSSLDPNADHQMASAASLGVALVTSALAIWGPNGLGLTATPDSPAAEPKENAQGQRPAKTPVLVFGGSTACGTIAIQLLRHSNLDPIAVCSPHNFDLVKMRGASAVFDRTSPAAEVAAAIKSRTSRQLRHVLDCIGDADSVAICYDAMSRVGGRYVALNRVSESLLGRRRVVDASFFHAAEGLGLEINLPGYLERPASAEKRDLVVGRFGMFQRLLDEGVLKLHPIQVLEARGLEGVLEGMQLLKSGNISGKKVVVLMPWCQLTEGVRSFPTYGPISH